MRWVKKYKRYVKRFAIFPITIGDETRWLETVYLRQRYNDFALIFNWYNVEFVTKGEYERAVYNSVNNLTFNGEAAELYRKLKEAISNDR